MRWTLLLVALLWPAAGNAQTNRLVTVERVTAEDPARFACAHTGRPCEADWIRAVAAALHAEDPAWGLNAKRDGPETDISLDVVTYRLGPTDRHVRVFDICAACGSSSARPVWNDITNVSAIGQPGTARWVRPASAGVPPPPTPPPAPTVPPVDLSPVLAKLDALQAENARLHADLASLALEIRDVTRQTLGRSHDAAVEALHAAERTSQILSALAVKPCFAGNQSGWAGGKIRLCPEP